MTFQPLYSFQKLDENYEAASIIEDYLYTLAQRTIELNSISSQEDLSSDTLTQVTLAVWLPDTHQQVAKRARDLVAKTTNPTLKKVLAEKLRSLIDGLKRSSKELGQTRDVDNVRDLALDMARGQGMDLTTPASISGTTEDTENMIISVLRKGLAELDLTDSLKDCSYRHIYLDGTFGISPVADAFGLGFAAAPKSVYCFKKDVYANLVGWLLAPTLEEFKKEFCKDCELKKSHSDDWQYTYKWQKQRDSEFRGLKQTTDESSAEES